MHLCNLQSNFMVVSRDEINPMGIKGNTKALPKTQSKC